MEGFKAIFKNNFLLKVTSANSIAVGIKLVISVVVQRIIALTFGEVGVAKIGQLKNFIGMLTSLSSLGIFNGVVKYVSEFRDNSDRLKGLFSTAFIFVFIGAFCTSLIICFYASSITRHLFGDLEFLSLIRCLALLPFIIGINRVFYAVINGLSEYKKFLKIELLSYITSILLLLVFLYFYELRGVLFSIVLTPLLQFVVIIYLFGSRLKKEINIKELQFKMPFAKDLLGFMLMSFVSTVLLNYIELDVRNVITNKISINEAGCWTAMNFISRNYMSFSSGIFTLYVIPRFTRIYDRKDFFYEVLNIYKILLPLFGIGMLLVFLFRQQVINIVYPNFSGLNQLFRWQLLGDFVRLATLVVAHQFLAKKMIKSFIFSELLSLGLFYVFAHVLSDVYGVEGVVMGHFLRMIILFIVVSFLVLVNFNKKIEYTS